MLRRARLAQVVTEDAHPYVVHVRDDWICYLCKIKVDRRVTVPSLMAPTLDHVVPLSSGGAHTYDNIRTAHFICNSRKHALSLEVFLALTMAD